MNNSNMSSIVTFGQVVIGPPGSGKTTYCHGIQQYFNAIGRNTIVVNLDPANDNIPYECSINVSSLISLDEVMDMLKLGPNGGMLYCMEFLEKNFNWLKEKLQPFIKTQCYILFDCPGQVELYTHQSSVKNVFHMLTKLDIRLAAVHLVDSHYCGEPWKFVSALLTSLSTMLQIELPHVNVLSKMDLVEQYGKLAFTLDYFTEVLDLSKLLDHIAGDAFMQKYRKLNKAIVDVIEDYSLVSFSTLYIEDEKSVQRLVKTIDQANGYVFGSQDNNAGVAEMMSCAVGADFQYFNQRVRAQMQQPKVVKENVIGFNKTRQEMSSGLRMGIKRETKGH